MIKPISSVSSEAARLLQQQILDGRLPAGSMLPGQRELSVQMGISRASLREAISMLEALGMLSARPGKGVLVTAGMPRDKADLPGGPEAIPAKDMFQYRATIEPMAAALAAGRIDPAGASELWSLQHALEQAIATPDLVAASEADLAFHLRIARLCGNPMFDEAIRDARGRLAHNLRLAFADLGRIQETADEHRRITLAISAGDPAGAREAMRAHLVNTAARVGIRIDVF
jgi:GntR family transcriptional repressor for pyruvate dehydrogenase complex